MKFWNSRLNCGTLKFIDTIELSSKVQWPLKKFTPMRPDDLAYISCSSLVCSIIHEKLKQNNWRSRFYVYTYIQSNGYWCSNLSTSMGKPKGIIWIMLVPYGANVISRYPNYEPMLMMLIRSRYNCYYDTIERFIYFFFIFFYKFK